ncbi:hypothetical protein CLTEP_11790 [Clostridium tepidiprofundi DSM 19306]|uniref:Uncharacterized protein n=1 Tax=Clostridium tepidiprofundi DSM 19306 TaxID=1121338 RepID=A0A151B5C3_9CLOT|nr:hypothetical protein [Clostridium tepidiprofundi]KYH34857.1 hypothetical protein CLTEP_11790 [Clostridium tepidiprofundi DSM 19306]
MELYVLISSLADIFCNIALVGTVITILLFIVTLIFNISSMKKIVLYFCGMFTIIWILQVGCNVYLLINLT